MVSSQNKVEAASSSNPAATTSPLNGCPMADGDKFYKERHYKEALNCYNQAVAADPCNVYAWYNKAQALVMCLKYTEAIATCQKTLELDLKHAPTYFLKSFAHGVLGQYQEALDAATKGLEIDPDNNMIWSTRGQYLYALGRLEEALESFGTALKMSPDNAYFQEITNKVKKWLQRDGQNPEWAEQVMAFLRQGGYGDALSAYQDAIKVDPRAVTKTFEKDYALAHMTSPEKMMNDFVNTKAKDQPQIQFELSQKEFELNREAWVEVTLTNKGQTAARNLVFTFSQDVTMKQLDISPEQIAQLKNGGKGINLEAIPDIPPGGKFKKLVSLTPAKLGQIPLEAILNYTDVWGMKQTRSAVVWISVFMPGGQLPAIPGFKFVSRLSSSESANIYVAQRNAENSRVIIKIPAFSSEQTLLATEYLNEIKQTARLVHPNIVKIYQFGETPLVWISTEYMSKGTLGNRIAHLSIPEALKISVLLADALFYGRMNRLAHRWVTPDNIFFDDQDVPKLANWRTAAITQKLHKKSNLNELVTPYYPPEKVSSGMGGLDFFSDIYQLGTVMYEMLTGQPVFSERGESLVNQIKTGQPHNPSFHNSSVRCDLDNVVMHCLAKNKKDRYQRTAALKTDLLNILSVYNSAK
jgi:tetratricopeptide (TPR) repeat protein